MSGYQRPTTKLNEMFRVESTYKPLAEAYNTPVRYVQPFNATEQDNITYNVLANYDVDVITDPQGAYEILQMLGVVD